MRLSINLACIFASSHLHVPDIKKGSTLYMCGFSEKMPMAAIVALENGIHDQLNAMY